MTDDNLRKAATALLDACEGGGPPDWLAPYTRALSHALAGETPEPTPGEAVTCDQCDEGPWTIDGSDPEVNVTWQQWECPACGFWHDRDGED